MDKVELASALRQVAHDAGVNVILDTRVDKDLSSKVTLQLEDVPLETAVRLLSEMANLKPVRVGNVLFVTSKENANELRQDPELTQPTQPLPVL
jgi:type II secretory pathway component HofQ